MINLDADPDVYYGEIPKEDFLLVLRGGKETGNIELAILDYVNRARNSYFKEHALDPRRALGLKLLGNLKGRKVLDYGCGLGTIGISAAKQGANVTFVDNCIPRLEVAELRAKQDNLLQTQFIACKNWSSLPDDQSSFDLIVLNGILEWVATTSGSTFDEVLTTQLDFLSTMQHRLSDKGSILLSIENRFALQYLLGYPEDHTEIQYLSLLSREEANKIHLKKKGKDFTTWTWSLNDYRALLPTAGLALDEAYAIFPDYRFPRCIVDLKDKTGLKVGMRMENYDAPVDVRNRFIDYVYEMGLIEHFVYSYCLLLKRSAV